MTKFRIAFMIALATALALCLAVCGGCGMTDSIGEAKSTVARKAAVPSQSEPRDITADNIPALRVGDYVRVSGPASAVCTYEGKISIGESRNATGIHTKYGIQYRLTSSSGNTYTVTAPSADPGGFVEVFDSHPPVAFRSSPTTIAGKTYNGTSITVSGKVSKIVKSEENGALMGFEFGESVVEDIVFL